MKVNIAIDFGTTNTLVATFDDKPNILCLHGISYELCGIDMISSVVGYSKERDRSRVSIGKETEKLPDDNVVKRMKRLAATKRYKKILGKEISYRQATKDFLEHLVNALRYRFLQSEIGSIVFTVPVDSYDTYRATIDEVCEITRIYSYHVIDESTAAALGYEIPVSKDNPCMIVDFGGGTLDISVVVIGREGKIVKAKVLGKSGIQLGGSDIDEWILEDFIDQHGLQEFKGKFFDNEDLRKKSENAKLEMSSNNTAKLCHHDNEADFDLCSQYTPADLSRILNKNRFFIKVQESIDSAIEQCYENGVKKSDIGKVLLIGGSSQIPMFKQIFETNFGTRVAQGNPFDAVVRGAANYLNDRVVDDFLHHKYALQHLNTSTGCHDYEVIVDRGCKYPSPPVKKIVSTPFAGQNRVALRIYEISESKLEDNSLIGVDFAESGDLLVKHGTSKILLERVPLNSENPEFITLDPPSMKNQERLDVQFWVDSERMLRIRVWDLVAKRLLIDNKIVARIG